MESHKRSACVRHFHLDNGIISALSIHTVKVLTMPLLSSGALQLDLTLILNVRLTSKVQPPGMQTVRQSANDLPPMPQHHSTSSSPLIVLSHPSQLTEKHAFLR